MNLRYRHTLVFQFLLLCSLGLSACGATPHQAFTYKGPGGIEGSWQSGQHIPIEWHAQSEGTSDASTPDPMTLKILLVGPFKNVDAVLSAIRQSRSADNIFAQPLIAVIGPTIQTDTWTKASYTRSLTIPPLTPGYYDLYYYHEITTGGKVIRIRDGDTALQMNLPT